MWSWRSIMLEVPFRMKPGWLSTPWLGLCLGKARHRSWGNTTQPRRCSAYPCLSPACFLRNNNDPYYKNTLDTISYILSSILTSLDRPKTRISGHTVKIFAGWRRWGQLASPSLFLKVSAAASFWLKQTMAGSAPEADSDDLFLLHSKAVRLGNLISLHVDGRGMRGR